MHHHHHHHQDKDWMDPLFTFHYLHKYVCACIFPCLSINSVRHMVYDKPTGGDDVEMASATVASVCIDAPCLAGTMALNQYAEEFLQQNCGLCTVRSNNDNDEEEINGTIQHMWREGKEYAGNSMNKYIAPLACLVYPFFVCPSTYLLRRAAMFRLKINQEGTLRTIQIAACCWPCALVQMEEELKGSGYDSRLMHQLFVK